MKNCRACKRTLDISEFRERSPGGKRYAQCKACISAREKATVAKKKAIRLNIGRKECAECKQTFALSNFWQSNTSLDGFVSKCKPCALKQRHDAEDRRTVIVRDSKECGQCKTVLPIDSFCLRTKSADGRDWVCRSCLSSNQARWRENRRKVSELRIMPAEQYCGSCKETLPASDFTAHLWRKTGLQTNCRICCRVKKYGLTKRMWFDMLHAQNEQCAACQIDLDIDAVYQPNAPHVDHDHESGAVRGILCAFCNAALGYVKDDPKILHGLLAYLKQYTDKDIQEKVS